MSTRFQKSYGEMKQKVEALEKELEESSNRKFYEIARKNQELQKLKQQISELEYYVKKVAKPPPSVTEYSPFSISPKKLFSSTVIQHPEKPPFLPPVLPEPTTIIGKRKETMTTASRDIPLRETQTEDDPLTVPLGQLMMKDDTDSQKSEDSEKEEEQRILPEKTERMPPSGTKDIPDDEKYLEIDADSQRSQDSEEDEQEEKILPLLSKEILGKGYTGGKDFDTDSQNSQDSKNSEEEKTLPWHAEDFSDDIIPNVMMASPGSGEASTSTATPGLHHQEINTPMKGLPGTSLFSLDDSPPTQWGKRLLDFKSFMDAKLIAPDVDHYKVIEEFCSRMTGTLKEWYQSLGPVNQEHMHRLENTDAVISTIHHEFLGNIEVANKEIRKEYFDMKCCSLKSKDIIRHFQRMQQRFYRLNGYNDPSLKSTYMSSLPGEIQEEMYRMLNLQNKEITQNPASSSCNMLKEVELICHPQWEVPPDVMREEYKKVHVEEFPSNDTPVYTSNLLWQEWNSPEHSWRDSQDSWPDINPCYYPGHVGVEVDVDG